ncbi:MAG: ABC transporter permease, partial [Ruminococcus sp.]|nr:ABC transporter permease [Ruminococcus sp.]
MNDENNYGQPVLDDIDYSAPAPKKEGPTGVAAPILDDIDYVAPTAKKGGPTGVSAPVLDDMDSYVPPASQKKGAPTGVSAPVLDDEGYTPLTSSAQKEPEVLVMSDQEIIDGLSPEQKTMFEGLPAEKQQQIIDMRRSQLGAVAPEPAITAAILDDEDAYVPPPKKEEPEKPAEPISAPILDAEPEPPKYVPKFVDEDLERAKREGAKKAVSSQLVSDQKDSKESLRMMLELKDQLRREEAAKGFKVVLVLAAIGLIGTVCFYLLYSGALGLDYKDGVSGFANVVKNSAMYIAIAMGVSAVGMISGLGFFKSISSLVYLLSGVIQVFPGLVMIPQHEGSMGKIVVLYAIAIVSTVLV